MPLKKSGEKKKNNDWREFRRNKIIEKGSEWKGLTDDGEGKIHEDYIPTLRNNCTASKTRGDFPLSWYTQLEGHRTDDDDDDDDDERTRYIWRSRGNEREERNTAVGYKLTLWQSWTGCSTPYYQPRPSYSTTANRFSGHY